MLGAIRAEGPGTRRRAHRSAHWCLPPSPSIEYAQSARALLLQDRAGGGNGSWLITLAWAYPSLRFLCTATSAYDIVVIHRLSGWEWTAASGIGPVTSKWFWPADLKWAGAAD